MTAAIKARGETAFMSKAVPAKLGEDGKTVLAKEIKAGALWSGGAGVVLRFRNSDMKRLEAELGEDWFSDLIEKSRVSFPTLATLDILLKHGAKKDGLFYEVPEDVLDEIPVMDLGELLIDAACISYKGKPLKEYLEESFEAYVEAQQKGEAPSPRNPDTTLLTTSEDAVSGQGSESKSSGT